MMSSSTAAMLWALQPQARGKWRAKGCYSGTRKHACPGLCSDPYAIKAVTTQPLMSVPPSSKASRNMQTTGLSTVPHCLPWGPLFLRCTGSDEASKLQGREWHGGAGRRTDM